MQSIIIIINSADSIYDKSQEYALISVYMFYSHTLLKNYKENNFTKCKIGLLHTYTYILNT